MTLSASREAARTAHLAPSSTLPAVLDAGPRRPRWIPTKTGTIHPSISTSTAGNLLEARVPTLIPEVLPMRPPSRCKMPSSYWPTTPWPRLDQLFMVLAYICYAFSSWLTPDSSRKTSHQYERYSGASELCPTQLLLVSATSQLRVEQQPKAAALYRVQSAAFALNLTTGASESRRVLGGCPRCICEDVERTGEPVCSICGAYIRVLN